MKRAGPIPSSNVPPLRLNLRQTLGIDDRKFLFGGRDRETFVECHNVQRGWPVLSRTICGGELQRIGGTQRMHPKKPHCGLTNEITRLDFVPRAAQLPQAAENLGHVPWIYAPSRSIRASAEAHSTSEAHQTSIVGSCLASASSARLDVSDTGSGTIAEASRNLIDLPAALQ